MHVVLSIHDSKKKKLLQIICVLTIGAHESELSVVGTFGSVLEYLVL